MTILKNAKGSEVHCLVDFVDCETAVDLFHCVSSLSHRLESFPAEYGLVCNFTLHRVPGLSYLFRLALSIAKKKS